MIEALILWKLYADGDKREDADPSTDGFILLMFALTAALWPVGIYMVLRELGRGIVLSALAASAIAAFTFFVLPIYDLISLAIFVYAIAYFTDK